MVLKSPRQNLIASLVIISVSFSCSIGPLTKNLSASSPTAFIHEGSVLLLTQADSKPRVVHARKEIGNTGISRFWGSALLDSNAENVIWVRSSPPMGNSKSLPSWSHGPWEVGFTNLESMETTVLLQKEWRPSLLRVREIPGAIILRVGDGGAAYGGSPTRLKQSYYQLSESLSASSHFNLIPEPESDNEYLQKMSSKNRSGAIWFGIHQKWIYYWAKKSFWGKSYLAGTHLESGKSYAFYVP